MGSDRGGNIWKFVAISEFDNAENSLLTRICRLHPTGFLVHYSYQIELQALMNIEKSNEIMVLVINSLKRDKIRCFLCRIVDTFKISGQFAGRKN
jgi:hypothetical protein